jgi:hypothetical protein
MSKPRIFIGSSDKQTKLLQAIERALRGRTAVDGGHVRQTEVSDTSSIHREH